VIKIIHSDKDNTWKYDTNGIKITEYIINPILMQIHCLMSQYITLCDETNDTYKIAAKLIYEIEEKTLHRKILIHIAPYFQPEFNV